MDNITRQDVVNLELSRCREKGFRFQYNQALNVLLFLYKQVLNKELGKIKSVARVKRRTHIYDPVNLIAKVLYGCGLRLFECLNLRVNRFNFDFLPTVYNYRVRQ